MAEKFKGLVEIQNTVGALTVGLDGENADIAAGGNGKDGDLVIKDKNGRQTIWIRGNTRDALIGENVPGETTIHLDGSAGRITIGGYGKWGSLFLRTPDGKETCTVNAGGNIYAGGNGEDGDLVIKDEAGKVKIHLDGHSGDIKLEGADCAEDFEILESEDIEPGTVMVIDHDGKLRQCTQAYDKTVAGVISGAGGFKPGIILDKGPSQKNILPLALTGKVFCKVDAQTSPIEVGSLLTTSATPGHARKASDPVKAFGAVIGKALYPLEEGKGLIPILVALH